MHQETLELAELKAAHALTPYPSDFEAFWKARMKEADNAPLNWQIVPSTEVTSSASAHFFDLTFVGIDGAEVYAKSTDCLGRTNSACSTVPRLSRGFSQLV